MASPMSIATDAQPEWPERPAPVILSTWCTSAGKRTFDFVISSLLVLVMSPVLLAVSVIVAVTSSGPVLFRQLRVGRNGKEFTLLKFRTMHHNLEQSGPNLTCKGDKRITAVGRFLRKSKLDELPQLFNVVRGEMSLVGPRPDLSEYVRQLPADLQQILALRPGITGVSSLKYVNEENVLAKVPPQQLREYYVHTLFPQKVRHDLDYARDANLLTDARVLIQTIVGTYRHSIDLD